MSLTTRDIYVIICAYTEGWWDDLVAAVESVQQQTLSPRKIIVVIDHNPGLLIQLQEQLSSVALIEDHEARGASVARNSRVAVAQGAAVAFLDDDAIAERNWIESLLAACYTDFKYESTQILVWQLAILSSANSQRSMSSLFSCRHEDLLRHNGIYIISVALMIKIAGFFNSYNRNHAWKKWWSSDAYYV